jgi:4-alpha-glucanotransferase
LPRDRFGEFLANDVPIYAAELGEAIHVFLARSQARLMLVQLEDAAGEIEQANLPGTTDTHPNWRRRLSLRLEQIFASDMIRLAALVTAARRQAMPEPNSE